MTGSDSGLYLNGSNGSTLSVLTEINGSSLAMPGTLSFTTGSIVSGSLSSLTKAGESVQFNPGTLTITGSFAGFTGTLFSGSFGNPNGPITWTLVSIQGTGKNKIYNYDLTGAISGTWYSGITVTGATTQLLFSTKGHPYTGGSIGLESGASFLATPEPGTLSLMGTGLVGLGLTVRQRLKDRVRAKAAGSHSGTSEPVPEARS